MSEAPPPRTEVPPPRVIAWEVTRSCPLACRHCRAAARSERYDGELTTDEITRTLERLAEWSRPLIVLTGGEPMLRSDIYELASAASGLGLPVAMAPCGQLVDDAAAHRMLEAGVRTISVSIDGATAATHDEFRGIEGAFEGAIEGIKAARRQGLPFQINTTVTRHNVDELPAIRDLAIELGAACFNPFLLVPTGRGKALAEQALGPERYERTLEWLADEAERGEIPIRVTCAPQYQRILRERGRGGDKVGTQGGCLGGRSFAFISHVGVVQICGFLEDPCGDLREADYDFRCIWENSPMLKSVRQPELYGGRCGYCEYRAVCGGCRARAGAGTGDFLAEDSVCLYQPRTATDKG